MTKKVYDRCGKELNDTPFWDIELSRYLSPYVKDGPEFYIFDLCDECAEELARFIKGADYEDLVR